ncbi:hypothetical protein [Afifella sp. IM 167]|uniref:hypothetical protein n=1 Tax=Afifella sp. IM 167 TaxID=2033586 RepID=UPI001CCF2502|nr:hypothetical protein [Afifella sp. IM 167]MBZ8135252.1 hypothetical protein [Afifella sp. IM 167]
MEADSPLDRLAAWLLVATTVCVVLSEWTGLAPFVLAEAACAVLAILLLGRRAGRTQLIFLAIAAILIVFTLFARAEPWQLLRPALKTMSFIAAFFVATTALRYAATSSEAIVQCGRYLAEQRPGRRYAALTLGGHLFGLILNYGSIALLGSLAEESSRGEPDPRLRAIRLRRMLTAIQRGFASVLAWSPLTFATAISISLIPGATWGDIALPGFLAALIIGVTGWALDTIFKPRVSGTQPARAPSELSWKVIWPLPVLLLLLGAAVGGLHLATGVRSTAVVILVVPLIAAAWVALQNRHDHPLAAMRARGLLFVNHQLLGYRAELVILTMASFIGVLGSGLLAPVVAHSGIDLSATPGWLLLIVLLWLVPITGQIGMNPLLSVSLIGPLLPGAREVGLDPADIVVALTSGWALSGASSPFTASSLVIGGFGSVSARHVGLVWNGPFTLASGIALSAFMVLLAAL